MAQEQKLSWLGDVQRIGNVDWQQLIPDNRNNWLVSSHALEFHSFLQVGNKRSKAAKSATDDVLFKVYSSGIKTNRDDVVFDFNRSRLAQRVQEFADAYNGEVDRYHRTGAGISADAFVRYDMVKWSESLKANMRRGRYVRFDQVAIRDALYRPFTMRTIYFDDLLIERRYQFPHILPTPTSETENALICFSGPGHDVFFCLVANRMVELKYANSTNGGSQCFPFFLYDEDATNRRENITDWALEQFRKHYADKKIGKWDIFYYVYGILHHPGYREKFADNLKRELPRIPFAPDFWAFAKAGEELARLHLDYEKLEPYPLDFNTDEETPLSYKVEKMRLSKDKTQLVVNPSLTLAGIPPEVFQYRLGNRSALDWVIDQYQITQDKRSGIRSDPNREDDEEYIVRLVGQVVRVSVETVRIVEGLPKEYAG